MQLGNTGYRNPTHLGYPSTGKLNGPRPIPGPGKKQHYTDPYDYLLVLHKLKWQPAVQITGHRVFLQ